MKKTNKSLLKGILLFLLTLLAGCSSTVKNEIKPPAIVSQYPDIKLQQKIKVTPIINDQNSKEDGQKPIENITIKYFAFDYTNLIEGNKSPDNMILVDELEKTSAFLAGYFNYLNDYLSDKNSDNIQIRISEGLEERDTRIATYTNLPFSSEIIDIPSEILTKNFLDKAIPNILATRVKNSMNEGKIGIYKVLRYRDFLIKKISDDINERIKNTSKKEALYSKKIDINNIFFHNLALIRLWNRANYFTVDDLEKINDPNMTSEFETHLKNLKSNSFTVFPLIGEKKDI